KRDIRTRQYSGRIGDRSPVTLLGTFERRRIAHRLLLHVSRGATPRRSNAPGAPGLPRRFASCPIFILAILPSPCSAKARTKKASGTAPANGGRSTCEYAERQA